MVAMVVACLPWRQIVHGGCIKTFHDPNNENYGGPTDEPSTHSVLAPARAALYDAQVRTLSLRSENSFLCVASKGSFLSIGSVGSALSIGSIGSFASVFSVGSAGSLGSVLSARASTSVLAYRTDGSILGASGHERAGAALAAAILAIAAGLIARRALSSVSSRSPRR